MWCTGLGYVDDFRSHKIPGTHPWVGRSPGEGNENPHLYSCLEIPMDRGAGRLWGPLSLKESERIYWLSTHTHTHTHTQEKWRVTTQERALRFDTKHRVCGFHLGHLVVSSTPGSSVIAADGGMDLSAAVQSVFIGVLKEQSFPDAYWWGKKEPRGNPKWSCHWNRAEIQFNSVVPCVTFSDSMEWNMPGFLAHHQLLELLKLMTIELVMPSNHLILCCPLLLLPSIPPSIRVFSNESTLPMRWPKYQSFSFNISPSNEHPGLISFRMDWLDLLAVQGTLQSLPQHHSSKAPILLCSLFFRV